MKTTGHIIASYGLLVLAGGIIGHWSASSLPSLIAGVSSGCALLACAWITYRKKMSGPALALFVTLLLEGFFIFRFARTLKFFPSALFSLLSLFVIILIAFRMRKQRIKPFSTIKELF